MIKKIIQLRCDEKTAETLDNDLNDVFEIKTTQDLFTEYGGRRSLPMSLFKAGNSNVQENAFSGREARMNGH
jgi:hypothetical protein